METFMLKKGAKIIRRSSRYFPAELPLVSAICDIIKLAFLAFLVHKNFLTLLQNRMRLFINLLHHKCCLCTYYVAIWQVLGQIQSLDLEFIICREDRHCNFYKEPCEQYQDNTINTFNPSLILQVFMKHLLHTRQFVGMYVLNKSPDFTEFILCQI